MGTFSTQDLINAILKASGSQVNSAFERLLEKYINISPECRSTASTSQNHLREFLKDENARDSSFPPILQKKDRDFISGSFARHTKIWPLDDIDILFPLDGATLIYTRGGFVTANTVVTDGGIAFNPLLTARWAVGNNVSSDLLVSGFAKVLKRKYSQSDVAKDGEAISVQLTIGATEESDGLKYDVVPCFRLEPHDGSAPFYLIPDGHNGWKHTNPRYDEMVCESLQKFHGGYYRKVVKLVKYWNANQLNGALGSYYIELALANHFTNMQVFGQKIGSISEGVKIALQALATAVAKGNIPSPVKDAPAVELKPLSQTNAEKLVKAVTNSANAASYERSGQTDEAMKAWKAVFGSELE